MVERTGFIIFTLWYLGIAINYYIVPLFFGRRKCTCGKQAACCGGSDSESDIGPIGQEIENDYISDGVKLKDVVNDVAAVVADEVISILDEPEAVEEVFQDSNVNGSESGEAGDAGDAGDEG